MSDPVQTPAAPLSPPDSVATLVRALLFELETDLGATHGGLLEAQIERHTQRCWACAEHWPRPDAAFPHLLRLLSQVYAAPTRDLAFHQALLDEFTPPLTACMEARHD